MTITADHISGSALSAAAAVPTTFAFYGRVSTEDNQDPESSRRWQTSLASNLITPRGGEIVDAFFDIGQSRSLPWQRRPEASRLLATLANPRRGFDAVVIGEPHRASLVARHDDLVSEYYEKIARYRAALDAGADPSLVAGWITEAQKQRDRAAARRSQQPPGQDQPATAPTADEIAAVLHRLGDLTQALAEADPEHKMEVYRALGLRLTYEPETQTVHASVDLGVHRWDSERVRSRLSALST